MSSKNEKFDALVEAALEDGESIESYGEYDEDSEEGHDAELVRHGSLWLVVERIDDEEDIIEPYTDEAEARSAFAEAKAEIVEEESGE